MSQVVARTGKPHGIRGEVTVEVRTDDPDARFVPGAVFATDPDIGALTLARARWHRDRLLLTFDEVADRTRAEEIRNTLLLVDASDDEDDEDAWFVEDLVGARVVVDGREIGEVSDLTSNPAQDLLHISLDAGGEALVPFVSEIVPEVDVEGGRIVCTPPPGLLEVGDEDSDGAHSEDAGA